MPDPFETASIQRFAKGSMLITASEQPKEAWLIVNGFVRQFDIMPNGSEFSLNLFKPGSVLSLTWLFGITTNRYYYKASSAVTVKRIPADDYRAYIESHPEEALAILQRLSRGLDGVFSRLAANSQNDAAARILNEIRIETSRFRTNDGRKLTSTMLSKRTGLARETVSRTLTRLLQDGSVERSEQGLRLTDTDLQ